MDIWDEADRSRQNPKNIVRYIDQLYRELSPERQASLQQALLEEEDRYGFRAWQLDLLEQHIAEAADRIDKQLSLLTDLRPRARSESARRLLDLLHNAREDFMRVRNHLSRRLDIRRRRGSSN